MFYWAHREKLVFEYHPRELNVMHPNIEMTLMLSNTPTLLQPLISIILDEPLNLYICNAGKILT